MNQETRAKAALWVAGIILAVLATACRPTRQPHTATTWTAERVTIKGSDTMVHLVTAWAEAYGKIQPGTEVSVTGGGSGTGIAALLNKATDVCAASREMSPLEKDHAAQKGLHFREIEVARDGIAVIVHPSNPITELTMEQLNKIFTGAYTQWKDAGGPDGEIIVLSRESSSGSYVFFQEHVLKKQDYTPRARLMPATSAIVQSVGEDALAIGYVGLGYAAEAGGTVKVIAVKADVSAPSVLPSEQTMRDGSYAIARALYFYANEPPSEPVSHFVGFCLGEAGQKIVRETGYVPVK